MDKSTAVRTRIAPSPTGYPHIGTIYQALFDWAYAKRHNGKFLVRIEDTDQSRLVPDAEEKIYASLDWFGLSEDESPRKKGPKGPYRQSERLEIYDKYALELIAKGGAYYCFCSKERLEQMRNDLQKAKKIVMYDKHCRNLNPEQVKEKLESIKDWVIRLKIPENTEIVVKDEIRGDIEFDSRLVDDQVLIKSDKFPTYHLAVVVDDHLMEITDAVRGEEWITSYPKHKVIYDYFEWKMPKYYHTSVLRNPDKSKLSKRHGHTSVSWYQEQGYLPESILNFLAHLGWSHPEGKEIFSLDEFVSLFDLKDLRAVAPIFDLQKLSWMNSQYIMKMDNDGLLKRIQHLSSRILEFDQNMMVRLVELAKTRIKTLREFEDLVIPFLEKQAFKLSSDETKLKQKLFEKLSLIDSWTNESIVECLKQFTKEHNIRFPVLYKLLIGQERGLPIADVFQILGKDSIIRLLS